MGAQDATALSVQQGRARTAAENLVHVPAAQVSLPGALALGNAEQELGEDALLPPVLSQEEQDAVKRYNHLMGVHVAYFRVCIDPTVASSRRLLQQAIQDLKNHCAGDALVAHYYVNNRNNNDPADQPDTTTAIRQQAIARSADASSRQHHGACRGFNDHHGGGVVPSVHREEEEALAAPVVAMSMSPALRLVDIKGKVAAFCADRNGSRFVQQALEAAAPEEIAMVYKEIMPCVRTLAVDMFGNHAIQKILEHGPRSCKRGVISNLIGHLLPLSLDKYSCRVVQKSFDVGEHDQKVAMAKELGSKVLRCVRDQFANHVVQKCVECLPSKDIHSILRSFYGRAKALSTHPFGCHVIQKVLARCKDHEIYHALTAEIMENVNKLAADRFGNYVVQQLVEHGGGAMRSAMVRRFAGRVVGMSYHKFASNVVEKCLAFGSQEDRRLIADEIVAGGGGGQQQHLDHLVDMMINPYANFVIQKMVVTAEERQVRLLLEVASSNAASLARYAHGRHVIDAMERFLGGAKAVVHADPAALPCRRR